MNIKNIYAANSVLEMIYQLMDHQFRRVVEKDYSLFEKELVKVSDSVGRKLAQDVFASRCYPQVALSAIEGYMFNLDEDITTIDQFKKHDKQNFFNKLELGENPYALDKNIKIQSFIDKYIQIGAIANTVISRSHAHPWHCEQIISSEDNELVPITKGQGLFLKGEDYQESELLLKQNEIINSVKKALMSQAGVDKILVYKDIKIVVLYADYDIEYYNKNLEFQYIQDCLTDWGYIFDTIKIKPVKENRMNVEAVDAGIANEFEQFKKEISKITEEYDFVVACGLSDSYSTRNLGLKRGFRQTYSILNNYIDDNKFYIYFGDLRQPISNFQKKYYENNMAKGNRVFRLENRAVVCYLPGCMQDIIINMTMWIKPMLKSFKEQKFHSPDYKVAVLTHDYYIDWKEGKRNTIRWAFVTQFEPQDADKFSMKKNAEITIFDTDDIRPDNIFFFRNCNCFIPIKKIDGDLKAGDHLYYLEI
ncbi:MoeA protein [Acinetobacter sp. WCHAc060033]|uniref:MoeA protein n=1 Tax=Acinetobacter sp. WCHAc060033 TaxID=2518624 RepID=UPI001022AE3D|nr:MoeA protein [Acinetobacter sp. WCHAc060033]RZG78312.1 MoeA protein [Acinetobacter sp. WCHAc060033]